MVYRLQPAGLEQKASLKWRLVNGVAGLVSVPFTCVSDAMVLNQFAADVRQKIRSVKRISVGDKVDSAENGTFLAAYATVKLFAVLIQLNTDAPRCQTFFRACGDDAGFGVDKMQFR
jgi:hypothetical protein